MKQRGKEEHTQGFRQSKASAVFQAANHAIG